MPRKVDTHVIATSAPCCDGHASKLLERPAGDVVFELENGQAMHLMENGPCRLLTATNEQTQGLGCHHRRQEKSRCHCTQCGGLQLIQCLGTSVCWMPATVEEVPEDSRQRHDVRRETIPTR